MTLTKQQAQLTQEFDYALTSLDKDFIRTMRTNLQIDKQETFTSDDFRRLLEPKLKRIILDANKRAHFMGSHFARAKRNGCYVWTGKLVRSDIPSNNGRHIKLWKLSDDINRKISVWNSQKP